MLIISPSTSSALAPHAAPRSWVMFVQANTSDRQPGPILIEGIKGSQIAERLLELEADNAFGVMLIGLIETPTPDEHADAIVEQYASDAGLHHDWYKATPSLIAFIQHAAQGAVRNLVEKAKPGALDETPVDINTIAKMIGCSVMTVRRMARSGRIPYHRWGSGSRSKMHFVPRDVIASLQRAT